jgi:hypothetical protein
MVQATRRLPDNSSTGILHRRDVSNIRFAFLQKKSLVPDASTITIPSSESPQLQRVVSLHALVHHLVERADSSFTHENSDLCHRAMSSLVLVDIVEVSGWSFPHDPGESVSPPANRRPLLGRWSRECSC